MVSIARGLMSDGPGLRFADNQLLPSKIGLVPSGT